MLHIELPNKQLTVELRSKKTYSKDQRFVKDISQPAMWSYSIRLLAYEPLIAYTCYYME